MSPIAALAGNTGGRVAAFARMIGDICTIESAIVGGRISGCMLLGGAIAGGGRCGGGSAEAANAIVGGCGNSPRGNPPWNTTSGPSSPRSIVTLGYLGKMAIGGGWSPSSSSHPMYDSGNCDGSAEHHALMVIGVVYG